MAGRQEILELRLYSLNDMDFVLFYILFRNVKRAEYILYYNTHHPHHHQSPRSLDRYISALGLNFRNVVDWKHLRCDQSKRLGQVIVSSHRLGPALYIWVRFWKQCRLSRKMCRKVPFVRTTHETKRQENQAINVAARDAASTCAGWTNISWHLENSDHRRFLCLFWEATWSKDQREHYTPYDNLCKKQPNCMLQYQKKNSNRWYTNIPFGKICKAHFRLNNPFMMSCWTWVPQLMYQISWKWTWSVHLSTVYFTITYLQRYILSNIECSKML